MDKMQMRTFLNGSRRKQMMIDVVLVNKSSLINRSSGFSLDFVCHTDVCVCVWTKCFQRLCKYEIENGFYTDACAAAFFSSIMNFNLVS